MKSYLQQNPLKREDVDAVFSIFGIKYCYRSNKVYERELRIEGQKEDLKEKQKRINIYSNQVDQNQEIKFIDRYMNVHS